MAAISRHRCASDMRIRTATVVKTKSTVKQDDPV